MRNVFINFFGFLMLFAFCWPGNTIYIVFKIIDDEKISVNLSPDFNREMGISRETLYQYWRGDQEISP